MFKPLTRTLSLMLVCTAVLAADVYRWTDKDGRVHYGDSIPPAQLDKGKSIRLVAPPVSDADRRAAEERLETSRSRLKEPIPAPRNAAPAKAEGGSEPPEAKGTCVEEWRKYDESTACFSRFRLANGGVKAEAFKHCRQVPRPPRCD